MGVAQFGRRAGLRSRLLEVQVLSPTSDLSRRSSIGSSASMPRSRLGVRVSSPTPDTLHAWPSGFRRRVAAPVRAVRFRQRAPNGCRSGASGRRAELKPPFFGGSSPPFGITVFCGWASAQLGLISLDLLGALPRPAIR